MNLKEATNWLEELAEIRMSLFKYEDSETEEKLQEHVKNFLAKYSILDLLIIKFTTVSIVVKFDIEDELKRRVKDVTKNND